MSSSQDENTNDQATPIHLPKLRKGLTYTFNDYDFDGKPQWVIHDPSRNKFFMIGWLEYEMLTRWALQDPEDLIYAVNNETTLEVDMQDVEHLISFLTDNYLLDDSLKTIYQTSKERNLFKDGKLFSWLVKHYLFFRVPLWHPDKFLTRTKNLGILLFNRYLLYFMMFLGVVAIYQIGTKWDEFVGTFQDIISWKGFLFYFISFLFVKLLHEAGHAYKCKEYGIPVPSCGVAFLVFWPVLYTDTTLSWTLNARKRLQIAIAGIQIETYVVILAALIWCNTTNLTLQTICYVTITINWISSLVVNASPFMRFDGYYILSDYMRMPNMQHRAFALARWQLRKWILGWKDEPPEVYSKKIHNFLIIYAFSTWLYRLFLYLTIALLVYFLFFKVAGIILFIIEIYYFILEPIFKEAKVWLKERDKIILNINTIISLTIAIVLLGVFFIPFKSSVDLPATIHYAHQFLYAPVEGQMQDSMPPVGEKVLANQPIVEISSPILAFSLRQAKLEYDKLLSEKRRAAVDNRYAKDKNSINSSIEKKKAEYQKLSELQNKLIITVPFNGILVDAATELHKGSYIKKNEWLGDVINPNEVEVEGYVEQIDLSLLKEGQTGYFYPDDTSADPVPVSLTFVEPLNPTELVCEYSKDATQKVSDRVIVETPCYHTSDFGGEIATYLTDSGDYVPVKSVYRVLFTANDNVQISHIKRGHVVVTTKPRSYAYRFFYSVKSLLIREKEF